MTVSREQADSLAALAVAIRADNRFGRWDKAGIVAAIGHVKDRSLADVALAVVRAADTEDLDTPGAIANPRALCWEERKPDRTRVEPFDPSWSCDTCSLPAHRHGPNSGHDFESVVAAARRRDSTPKPPLRELLAAATPTTTTNPRTKEVPQ